MNRWAALAGIPDIGQETSLSASVDVCMDKLTPEYT